jgi:glycosyltransferase involved in cell wall biosynthesis
MAFDHVYLRERIRTVNGRYIHNNPDVVSSLRRFAPDVIVTNGFNPTHLYAFGYAMLKRAAFVPMTDGTFHSEQSLSGLHKAIRRFVYARSSAFIAASAGSMALYASYGIAAQHCFLSCLCTDNDAFRSAAPEPKAFDFIFCGRIEPGKNPLFALQVAIRVAKRIERKVSILYVGSGSQEQHVKQEALRHAELVDAAFNGFAAQQELPALYRSARIFLFPSAADVWGVVANEACAAGLPVMVSPHAGVAGELVVDGENGFVCELDPEIWAERAAQLLTRSDLYAQFSRRSFSLVGSYSFDRAAAGLAEACRYAAAERGRDRQPAVLRTDDADF